MTASVARAVQAAAGSPLLAGARIMTPKPENEKTPNNQTPSNQTPTQELGKPTRELAEDALKRAAGGLFTAALHGEGKKVKIA
jgi:hypothetical protein